MKFVSLLSGGKDSCFNVIKCIEHGHELVCLANLAPPENFIGEDMNSFMYQTAGHTALPFFEECFGVPLLRRPINGTAVSQKLDYLALVDNDEVEDLYLLLKEVKEKFPKVEGVSCGAIVSTYQRLRVESICQRLGMTVLSYLWQRDRVELLQEMVAAGVDAVLVKVAGAGLDPQRHLGKSLAALQPTLLRLHGQFGLDVCGEGGEYESLVLDCAIFKKRLVLQDTEVAIDEENYTVGYLKIGSCACVDKPEVSGSAVVCADGNAVLLQTVSTALQGALQSTAPEFSPIPNDSTLTADQSAIIGKFSSLPRVAVGSDGLGQTSLVFPLRSPGTTVAPPTGPSTPATTAALVQSQLRDIFLRLQEALRRRGVTLADVVFVHLYIASSAVFKAVNDEYCRWFGHYPPSRSCVCVPLPEGVQVCLDACFLRGSHARMLSEGRSVERSVLHVKSMSEWAPLCIGPYAQANTVFKSIVLVAGQIPLNPATMNLFSPAAALASLPASAVTELSQLCGTSSEALGFVAQMFLCLRHAHRVLQVCNSSLSRALLCTVYVNLPQLPAPVACALSNATIIALVRRIVCAMERVDAPGGSTSSAEASAANEYGDMDDMDQEEDESGEPLVVRAVPVLVVCTSGLPRDAQVEVEVVGFCNNAIPAGLFQHRDFGTESSGAAAGVVDMAGPAPGQINVPGGLAAAVDSWPVWHGRSAGQQDEAGAVLGASSSATHLLRSLCFGFVTVHQVSSVVYERNGGEVSTACTAVEVDEAARVLVAEIALLLSRAKLQSLHLRSLRVYFAPESVAAEDLSIALGTQLALALGTGSVPLLLVPMQSLSVGASEGIGGPVLAAQVVAVDSAQVETEDWIRVRE